LVARKFKTSNNQPEISVDRLATGQEMVREFYFESGKIDILKKSQGKLK